MAQTSNGCITEEYKGVIWKIDPELCKSCGLCILKCPKKALSFDLKNNEYLGMPVVKCDIEKCIACKTCQNFCPEGAIEVEKEAER